jgi:hypothetical protein
MAATSTFVLNLRGDGGATTGTIENASTLTASSTTNAWHMEPYSQARIYFSVSAATGTSPTLDVRIQSQLGDKSTWHDIAAFTQFTGAANRVMSLVSGGNKEEAKNDGALTAGTVNAVYFGRLWRLKYTVGGTNPNFTVSAYIEAQ